MRRPGTDLYLILVAAGLFLWGILRALARGDPAVYAWTTFAMAGLLVLGAVNSFVRSGRSGTLVLVVSLLFAGLVVAALLLTLAEGISQEAFPALRALFFFALTGAAGWLQRRPVPTTPGSVGGEGDEGPGVG